MTNEFVVSVTVDTSSVVGWRGRFWLWLARTCARVLSGCVNFCARRIERLIKIRESRP